MADTDYVQGRMTTAQKSVLTVVVMGSLMAAIDGTIVLLAIPDITSTLNTNLATSIWIILSYLLVAAIMTTQLGRVGDIYGRGRMFNLGFLVFTVGSVLCGASFSIYMLIMARVLQGVGGAFLSANSGAIIADTFERNHRGKAFGFLSFGWSLGAVLGIVLGGVLTTFAGWPYIFYINVPIGAMALYLGIKYIKPTELKEEHIDLKGVAVLSAMLLLITVGATGIGFTGFAAYNVAMLAIGIALLPVFILMERHAKFPTIDMGVFKRRIIFNSIMAAFLQSLGFLAITFIIIMYLQGVRGLDPLNAALLLVPGYVASGLNGPYMGRLSDRLGARTIATTGIILMILAASAYLTISPTTHYYLIVLMTLMAGVGSAMFFPANTSAVMANATEGTYGMLNGLLRTLSSIGLLGSFVLTVAVAALAVTRNVAFQIFLGTSDLTGNISAVFVQGMHAVFMISILILAVAAVLSALRGKEQRHSGVQGGMHAGAGSST